MFSFAIENCRQPYYMTEKLIDCFITGTVPIYWGADYAIDFFNPDGMIGSSGFKGISKSNEKDKLII
jgi:hypothetical protein